MALEPSTNLPVNLDEQGMRQYLHAQVDVLAQMINNLSSTEGLSTEKLEIIMNLGNAAYHLSVVRDSLSKSSEPQVLLDDTVIQINDKIDRSEVVDVATIEAAQSVTPVISEEESIVVNAVESTVIPADADITEKPVVTPEISLAEVVEVSDNAQTKDEVNEVEVADDSKRELAQVADIPEEPIAIVVKPEVVAVTRAKTEKKPKVVEKPAAVDVLQPEPQKELTNEKYVVKRINDLEMSANEVTEIQKIIDHLSGLEDRVNLKDIFKAVFGNSRLPKARETRIVQMLDGYANAGVLRAYGRTYGYRTGAEREIIVEQTTDTYSMPDDDIHDFDVEAIALMREITIDGTIEVNIGQFVRNYYKVQQLSRTDFTITVDRLNELARRGYLQHADGSPWYSLGKRHIFIPEMGEVPQQEHVVTEVHVEEESGVTEAIEESPVVTNEQEHDDSLTLREQAMLDLIKDTIKTSDWFKQSDIDFSELIPTGPARSQAFSKLAQKLVDAGILISNGKERGGRKYTLSTEMPKIKNTSKVEVSSVAAHLEIVDDTSKQVSDKKVRSFVREQVVRRSVGRTEIADDSAVRMSPVEEASMLVRVEMNLKEQLAANDNGARKLSVIIEKLAKDQGITIDQSRALVGKLVENGSYHYVSKKGVRFLEEGPSAEKQEATIARDEIEEKEEIKAWTERDTEIAIAAFAKLLELQHVQQGIEFAKLVSSLGTSEQEDDIRRSIRKIASCGFLEIKRNANLNTRSDHSKKIYSTIIKLPSQEFKKRLKNNPNSVLKEMAALVKE